MISDEKIISDFGLRLRQARITAGMTQEELGGAIGADKSRISDYENGNRKCGITTAYRLCKAVNSPFDFLFEGKVDEGVKSYAKSTDREKLVSVLVSLGHAIIDWGFVPFSDEEFADYSTMHALGLAEDSLGEILKKFESIRNAAGASGSVNFEKNILAAAEECADELLGSESYSLTIGSKKHI